MTDDLAVLDRLLDAEPVTPPVLTGAKGRPAKCRRHDWSTVVDGQVACGRCGSIRNDYRSTTGRRVNQRSKREERNLAALYRGIRTGHRGGPDDVQTDLANIQSKAGTGWWSKRYWAELLKLPRTGGRVPLLIVSNGQPGNLVHRYVVVDERDFRSMFGDRILDQVIEP